MIPKDACRYLVNLANLRGGLEYLTVVVLHLGPWVEPDTAVDLAATAVEEPRPTARRRSGSGSTRQPLRPGGIMTAELATVEDHPYRTAECPITKELIEKYAELIRRAQAHAVEHAWSLDWTQFAKHRRAETEARAADNLRLALRELGEMMVLLGQAARFHRKARQRRLIQLNALGGNRPLFSETPRGA